MTGQQLWEAALRELALQMTKATFDTWVRPTFPISFDGAELVVGCHSPYAKEWLENRVVAAITRTVAGIVGHAVQIRYEVRESGNGHGPAPHPKEETEARPCEDDAKASAKEIQVTLIDKPCNDFIMLPRYDILFWQPYLESATFSTFLLLRAFAREFKVAWGKTKRVRVDLLAACQGVHRQTITGRRREGAWLKGTFDRLNDAGIARIALVGEKRDVFYDARVLHQLPLLAPAQLARLDPLVQVFHAQYLKEFDVDFERWEQLEIPSLVTE